MKNRTLISDLTLDALFIAIIALMTAVPNLGFITLGPLSITLVTIPVLIGASFLGWKRGLMYGFAFGIASLIKASTMPAGTFDALFINPLISVLPRALFGLTSGLLFTFFKKIIDKAIKNRIIIGFISAFSTLVHSFLVFFFLFLFEPSLFPGILLIVWANVIAEVVAAFLLIPLIYSALYRPFSNRNVKYTSIKMEKKRKKKMDFKKIVKPYEAQSIQTLIDYVNIDSVHDPKTVSKENPYGKGVSNALNFVFNLAKKDGFEVKNIENRVVEIYFGDKTLPNIGIFAHADVVPATGEWVTPPFAAQIREGKLYARGTSDDKGPGVAAYYAAKALVDNKLLNGYSVRLVIGGDEERGSSCMNFYFNEYKAPAPKFGFTPDAEFPLIYGEKAITNFKVSKKVALGPVSYLKGGEAPNSVIDKLVIRLTSDEKFTSYLTKHRVNFTLKHLGEEDEITFIGKSAHGSLPHLGINAGLTAFKYLGEYYSLPLLTNIAMKLEDSSGKTIGGYVKTPLLGETTYNVGLANYSSGELSFVVNFRYPETVKLENHLKHISEELAMEINVLSNSKYLLFDPKSEFITTLLKAYQDETGDIKAKPLAIGGGTYAKECPNTVAFGSAFEGRSGDIHQANEHVLITDIYEQTAIYARAIYYLGTKLCA